MLDPKVTRRSKRALALKRGTEKDWKEAMPQVGRSNKIAVVHPSQIRYHHIWFGNADDEGKDGLYDKRL